MVYVGGKGDRVAMAHNCITWLSLLSGKPNHGPYPDHIGGNVFFVKFFL